MWRPQESTHLIALTFFQCSFDDAQCRPLPVPRCAGLSSECARLKWLCSAASLPCCRTCPRANAINECHTVPLHLHPESQAALNEFGGFFRTYAHFSLSCMCAVFCGHCFSQWCLLRVAAEQNCFGTCRSVYFFIFWHERWLTFKRTPINDAHELHLCAETSRAYQRCYFCKQFEGTASYGRIRVSCAHSLICKVCVHCECVCACVCMSKLSLCHDACCVCGRHGGLVEWRAHGHPLACCAHCPQGCFYSDCALTYLLFKGQVMGAVLLLGRW